MMSFYKWLVWHADILIKLRSYENNHSPSYISDETSSNYIIDKITTSNGSPKDLEQLKQRFIISSLDAYRYVAVWVKWYKWIKCHYSYLIFAISHIFYISKIFNKFINAQSMAYIQLMSLVLADHRLS